MAVDRRHFAVVGTHADGPTVLVSVGPRPALTRAAAVRRWKGALAEQGSVPALAPPADAAKPVQAGADGPPGKPVTPRAGPIDGALDMLIAAVELPTRMHHFADRKGIATLRELAAISPRDLVGEPNLARITLAQTRVVVEEMLGQTWEALAAQLSPGASPAVVRLRRWDLMRTSLPEPVAALALDDLDLPARVRSYAATEGLRTVADLARRSELELLAAPNFSRTSVSAILTAVARMTSPNARPSSPGADLLTTFRKVLDGLDPVDRTIVVHRSGLDGPKARGSAIARMLGRLPSFVYQRERSVNTRLSRERYWIADVRARAAAAMGEGGAVPLERLATDPWWAAIVVRPDALEYIGAGILAGAFHVVRVEARAYMASIAQEALDEARAAMRVAVEGASLPQLLTSLHAKAAESAGAIGATLSGALWDGALKLLVLHEDERGRARAFGFRSRGEEAALAILRASPRPMHLRDLVARTGPLTPIPPEILHLGPDLVGAPRHIPRLAAWTRRLAPIAIGAMGRRAAGRRWTFAELFDAVRAEIELPAWLDAWHVGAALKRSGRFRDAGFVRLALPGGREPAPKKAPTLAQEILSILRAHGGPLPDGELRLALAERTSCHPDLLSFLLGRAPFVRCDADRIGLVERDLPGGAAAVERAADHVAAALDRRGTGLAAGELRAEIAPLSRAHGRWTREMCLSALKEISASSSAPRAAWASRPGRPRARRRAGRW